MDWREWLSFDLYRKIWFWAGKPFTYWLRDFWHRFEFFWIMGLIGIGVWLGHHYNWIEVLKILGIFSVGYIAGHLFWSTTSEDYKDGGTRK